MATKSEIERLAIVETEVKNLKEEVTYLRGDVAVVKATLARIEKKLDDQGSSGFTWDAKTVGAIIASLAGAIYLLAQQGVVK